MKISVLRLGHRVFRDQRISTHCFLIARALGASGGYYTGERDRKLEKSVKKISEKWGGQFEVKYLESCRSLVEKFSGKTVHLTAYGIPFTRKMKEVKSGGNLLVIVGGEKVPAEIYRSADFNLSVGSQPHSEVAALAIFLYELRNRRFKAYFSKARMKIIPCERGKLAIRLDES
jgi:tRNA (cytidine56-2'-O)-methyltransferase